jgi:hypothetical protein
MVPRNFDEKTRFRLKAAPGLGECGLTWASCVRKGVENPRDVGKTAGRGCRGSRVQMGGFCKVVIDKILILVVKPKVPTLI